jgi:hypothetical protein
MLKVVTLLWDPTTESYGFSRCYDEKWVERLYDGFARNLTVPWSFVLFTDRPREIARDVVQVFIRKRPPTYGTCIEPYMLNDPMILVGLDTVVTGNVDHLAEYCLTSNMIALPRDPFQHTVACNGVALVPAGQRAVYDEWRGENDMLWMRKRPHKLIDFLFPGHVESYKGRVKGNGLHDERIVYFHGNEKPHELPDVPWIRKHWLGENERSSENQRASS